MDGPYAIVQKLVPGERLELTFPLNSYETTERAAGVDYRVQWKGSTVLQISPPGPKLPLYVDRAALKRGVTPVTAPRYP